MATPHTGRSKKNLIVRLLLGIVLAVVSSACEGPGSSFESTGRTASDARISDYEYVVIQSGSFAEPTITGILVNSGFKVIPSQEYNIAKKRRLPDTTLSILCLDYGTREKFLGYSVVIGCVLSEFASGREIYVGRGEYMGLTARDDIPGAAGEALKKLPARGGIGSIVSALAFEFDGEKSSVGPKSGAKPVSTGSGFIVSRSGHVLTNFHVVEDCRTIKVRHVGTTYPAALLSFNKSMDLAVLRALDLETPAAFAFRSSPTKLGESVIALGYPLTGILSSELKVTNGIVSSLSGLDGDPDRIQITVPVQPGNSGGPLLDDNGRIVGVVSSKLNAIRVAKITGDIPQNVNFAIKGELARSFLSSRGIVVEVSADAAGTSGIAAIVEQKGRLVSYIECLR